MRPGPSNPTRRPGLTPADARRETAELLQRARERAVQEAQERRARLQAAAPALCKALGARLSGADRARLLRALETSEPVALKHSALVRDLRTGDEIFLPKVNESQRARIRLHEQDRPRWLEAETLFDAVARTLRALNEGEKE